MKIKGLNGMLLVFFLSVIFSCTNRNAEEDRYDNPPVTESEFILRAKKMANSDMKRNPEAWMLDFNDKPKWNYTHGVVCTAYEQLWRMTGDTSYYNYIEDYADFMIDNDANIITYDVDKYNIDMINSGKFLFAVYDETGNEKYKKAIDRLREQMKSHPRTSEGGFWHKKRYPRQMWLDGLYMASPFLSTYAVKFNEPALLDDVANQIHLITKYTRDEKTGLFYHGWDESREQKWADPQTGLSENFWGRGMGWFAMALVDVLDDMPEDHPKYDEIVGVTKKMAEVIAKYQDEESGVWYQVLDMPDREGNYLESSVSSMFTYFLVKAVRKGYIDEVYLDNANEAYQGIKDEFIIENNGQMEITQVCSSAGLGGNPFRDGSFDYYVNEEIRSNDPKAVGPFIYMLLEYEKLREEGRRNLPA